MADAEELALQANRQFVAVQKASNQNEAIGAIAAGLASLAEAVREIAVVQEDMRTGLQVIDKAVQKLR